MPIFKNVCALIMQIVHNRNLMSHLTRRDIVNRYKGSYAGIIWSFLNPLMLLSVYTFVFSVIMKSRWGMPGEGRLDFAIVLFAGLACYNMYADATNRSSNNIVENKNYVKKVIFPLAVLPVVLVNSSFFNGMMSYLILVSAVVFTKGIHSWGVLLLPLLFIPLYLMTLGVCYLISSVGVFVRDVAQIVTLFNMAFMFLSPIFFPLDRIPPSIRDVAALNPIAEIVTQIRNILIFDGDFYWTGFLVSLLISSVIFVVGVYVFDVLKKGFADVL